MTREGDRAKLCSYIMDRYEAELKKLAIDLIVMAGENNPERHIAKWLESFRNDIRNHEADV